MTKVSVCVNPVIYQKGHDTSLEEYTFVEPDRADYINQVRAYGLNLEITNRCAGSCLYCYTSSTTSSDITLPREKVFELIDQGVDMGLKLIDFVGGDPLLHPDWAEMVVYAAERGLRTWLCPSPLISKKDAAKISELWSSLNALDMVLIHIDTIDQETYNKVHSDLGTLHKKIQGYRNLLEAGYPPHQVAAIIVPTKPILETINRTLDWYVDEMGTRNVCYTLFKLGGFGNKYPEWEPTLSETKQILDYRAKKLGQHFLRTGAMEASFFTCRSEFCVLFDGNVVPCTQLRDVVVGNIYQEDLREIFDKHRDELLHNYKISGYCGEECQNRDVCFGCRATAYYYLGDVRASDPKCFMNPQAKERYYPELCKLHCKLL